MTRLPPDIAIVDGGSFVLPYDVQLARALAARGAAVTYYGSQTRYNAELLPQLQALPGVDVRLQLVSGSVAPRWRGVLGYTVLLTGLLWRARRHTVVNLQFSVLWPLEWLLLWPLRRRLVYTVHNAVPHGWTRRIHPPTRRLAALARRLVFVSEATRREFLERYGAGFASKAAVLPHGLLPVRPFDAPVPYAEGDADTGDAVGVRDVGPADDRVRTASADRYAAPQALVFWGTVKPYKGVDLIADLARSAAFGQRGTGLEVHGAWARELAPLRETLAALHVAIDDSYLDPAAVRRLLAREVVFLLPYRSATQSGALYTLLSEGCVFIAADVGDLGDFMRRHGLGGLLLRDRGVAAVVDCLDHLATHRGAIARAFQAAQDACRWERLLGAAPDVYALGPVLPMRQSGASP